MVKVQPVPSSHVQSDVPTQVFTAVHEQASLLAEPQSFADPQVLLSVEVPLPQQVASQSASRQSDSLVSDTFAESLFA